MDSKLNIDDFVVVRDYREVIGVSRKLKPTYDYIPFKVLNIKYFYCILLNLLDGSQILRAVDDLKKIPVLEKNDSPFTEIPNEIFNMLNIITDENIIEIFSKKKDESPKNIEPRTRLEIEKEREKDLLLNEILDFDEDESLDFQEKTVRFDV